MHGLAHEGDAIFPAVQVAAGGGDAALKLMADIAVRENQVAGLCLEATVATPGTSKFRSNAPGFSAGKNREKRSDRRRALDPSGDQRENRWP